MRKQKVGGSVPNVFPELSKGQVQEWEIGEMEPNPRKSSYSDKDRTGVFFRRETGLTPGCTRKENHRADRVHLSAR